jgi:polyisoprenoid-binding protein YceI
MASRTPIQWRRVAGLIIGLALCGVPPAAAHSIVEFTVSGCSTVRNWTCTAQGVIAVTPATAGTPAPGFATGVQTATVTVPVKGFRCPNDEMTQHLNESLKADKFPEIVYRLEKYDIAGGRAQATGTMTVTGVSKPVTVPVTLTSGDKGVQVEGNTRIEFATFDLEPPTVFLGMLKVGPQIRIAFKGLVAR